MHNLEWLTPENPLFYWYVYFIFGPAFMLGWWGLVGMALIHLIIWALLLWSRRKAARGQSLFRRLLGAIGLLILANLLSGVLVYGVVWLLAHLPF